MKFFLLFLFACMVLSITMRRRPESSRLTALVGLSLFVCFGYFFLNQI